MPINSREVMILAGGRALIRRWLGGFDNSEGAPRVEGQVRPSKKIARQFLPRVGSPGVCPRRDPRCDEGW